MVDSPKTRVSLILRLQQRADGEAWEQFVELYRPFVYRIAVARGLQHADANDLIQNVFVRVARSVKLWDPDSSKGSFRGWLGKITRNLLIDFIRNRNRLPRTAEASDVQRLLEQQPVDCEATQFIQVEFEKQLFAWAAEHVQQQIAPKQWQAFWLTAVEDQPSAVAADQLGMSVGALYVAKSRIMAMLKSTIATAEANDES